MRCPECAERNSVAARKCEFCGNKFKKKPFPLSLKLACGGIAVAITASIAASYVVPRLVDPEENLGRVAKRLAAGPTSVEQARKVKTEFAGAVKNFLKTSGDDKPGVVTANLQKLLPSSAFEVHVVELPRGLRVVEVDTVLQAASFLVMKTSAGTKVFDLPGFEVFDDARILNDSAGPVLALLGHSSGPPPHKPIVRTYALLPDYIADETDKLVPAFNVNGVAKFAKNGQDIHIEFNMPAVATAPSGRKKGLPATSGAERLAYGNLKWKDARYSSDFSAAAALAASRETKQTVAVASAGAPARAAAPGTVSTPPAVAVSPAVATPSVVTAPQPQPEKIVVRSFTAADAAHSNNAAAAARTAMTSDSVMAAVPVAVPAINNARQAIASLTSEIAPQGLSRAERRKKRREAEAAAAAAAAAATASSSSSNSRFSHSRSHGEVIASGATLRASAGRGGAPMNSFGRGTAVTVLGKEGDWYRVRVNGQEGYIYSSLVNVGGSRVSSSPVAAQVAPTVVASEPRHSRRHRRYSQSAASTPDSSLVADATLHHKSSRSNKRQVAAAEPILVP
jgi:hypothetical protein